MPREKIGIDLENMPRKKLEFIWKVCQAKIWNFFGNYAQKNLEFIWKIYQEKFGISFFSPRMSTIIP